MWMYTEEQHPIAPTDYAAVRKGPAATYLKLEKE